VAAFPELSGRRLHRELRDRGFTGGYTTVTDFLRQVRPAIQPIFERRFETPPGQQAQVDFAHFQVTFTDAPSQFRVVWLFSLVLGHSRWLWGRFVAHQDLHTLLRCHAAAFVALGGVPAEILYDRTRAVVSGQDADGGVVHNKTLLEFARHFGFLPKPCRPYRAKTTDEIEQSLLCDPVLLSVCPWVTARHRAGHEVQALPRSHYGRSFFAALMGTLRPRLVQPSVSRL
jgi:transposase